MHVNICANFKYNIRQRGDGMQNELRQKQKQKKKKRKIIIVVLQCDIFNLSILNDEQKMK